MRLRSTEQHSKATKSKVKPENTERLMDDKLDEEAESLGVLKSPNQTPPNSWQLWNITNSKTV